MAAAAAGQVQTPFRRKLQALQFEFAQSFNPDDQKQFRTVVLFLEEMKIRHYELAQRAALRKYDSADWDKAFAQYLVDLECPRAEAKQSIAGADAAAKRTRAVLLDWLLNQAVFAEFKDDAAAYNAAQPAPPAAAAAAPGAAAAAAGAPAAAASSAAEAQINTESKAFADGVERLARLMKLPAAPAAPDSAVALKVVRERLQKFVAERDAALAAAAAKPAGMLDAAAGTGAAGAAAAAGAGAAGSVGGAAAAADLAALDAMDLGMPSTGDALVDRAAKVLRLLYINDLRQLQTLINEILVQIQDFTANPTTDARLGVVGV